ncbi:hypothetical protein VMT65_31940 [Nocardia sp. CDC153]|uniref:hypothetical protein n=1 Tax=Nocardia sp. CDC153 TaxID=3112167 RepID=UPI002DBC8B41|nr:hypothetical protein [Nocardia sp. CDC153]MEC3957684.1 hypothetical protein [Nocardia sp. CDC153]
MNGNSIPPGYRPNDRLWTQDTEVFEAIRDDEPEYGGGRKGSQASKYAIIGLSATIVVAVLAIGFLLVSGHGGWNAAPNATGPTTPRVVLTPPPSSAHVTTTPNSSDSGSTSDTTTSASSSSTTTTTTSIAAQAACDQPGQTTVTPDGTVLTCDVAADSHTRWLPVSRPSVGLPCNTAEAGTFAYSPTGTQLVCTRKAGSTTPTYIWDSPGTLTTGTHDPGSICNLKKDVIAKSTTGRAVYCLPTSGSNGSNYIGAWQYGS